MHKVLSVILVGLLLTTGPAVPACFDSNTHHQTIFSPIHGHRSDPHDDGGIIYIPPNDSRGNAPELETMMQRLITDEMATQYHQALYVESLNATVCGTKINLHYCQIEILEPPTIHVIPAKLISFDVFCNTPTCSISLTDQYVYIRTTHSDEKGMMIVAGSGPFENAVEYTAATGYGFSDSSETLASLSYTFSLREGDAGHVSIVNAQVSANVRLAGCKCASDLECLVCKTMGLNYKEDGHHEVVVLKNGVPRSYVGFVHQKKQDSGLPTVE
ncbi:hypothetical protein BGZ93_005944 [Podila epicladia]|nr:hypothetical protein BGZ92_005354 [Podila epicladia]KAG0095397.1 hypothetical protein BGZ93_005944 [Podila epicladia]